MLKNPLNMAENEAVLYLKASGFSDEIKALHNLRLLNETPFKGHIASVKELYRRYILASFIITAHSKTGYLKFSVAFPVKKK